MTERVWRLIFGSLCLIFLTFGWIDGIYSLAAYSAFEGITNLRLPVLLSKINSLNKNNPLMIQDTLAISPENRKIIPFAAQRIFRLSISLFLAIPLLLYPQTLWFFPWFLGIMLSMSGLTGVCPMMLLLQWLGFKSAD
jgi:DUF2892 family protein